MASFVGGCDIETIHLAAGERLAATNRRKSGATFNYRGGAIFGYRVLCLA